MEAGSLRASSSGRRRPAKRVATGTASNVLRRSSAGGARNGDDRRATSVGARTAGGLRSRRDSAFSFGKGNGGSNERDNGARLERRRLREGVKETNFVGDGTHLGESRSAPEVVGRLRAKVAELELTGQVWVVVIVVGWAAVCAFFADRHVLHAFMLALRPSLRTWNACQHLHCAPSEKISSSSR